MDRRRRRLLLVFKSTTAKNWAAIVALGLNRTKMVHESMALTLNPALTDGRTNWHLDTGEGRRKRSVEEGGRKVPRQELDAIAEIVPGRTEETVCE
jgi:hypothetical protein